MPERAPRITQRIPRSQRKRRPREVTLSAEAEAVLAALPAREASAYVERAVLELSRKEARARRRTSAQVLGVAAGAGGDGVGVDGGAVAVAVVEGPAVAEEAAE